MKKKLFTLAVLSLFFGIMYAQTDVTSKLTNADMEDNTLTGWTTDMVAQYDGNSGYSTYAGFTDGFMETWTGSYNTTDGSLSDEDGYYYLHDHSATQSITTENGTYRLSAMIIAVQQSEASGTVIEFTKGVKLFANTDSVECATYDGTPTQFTVYTKVTDGTLNIGLNIANTTANWVAWDNVTLTYYDITILGSQLQDLIDKVNTEMGSFTAVADAVIVELDAALNAADVYADDATIQAATDRLQAAYDAAIASNDAFAALLVMIEKANSNYMSTGVGADVLDAAINHAQSMYEGTVAATADVIAETKALQNALTQFMNDNASEETGYDFTSYLTNPEMETNTTGWTATVGTASFQYNVAEFYDQDFDISQTVKVPNGHYKITVQGFYRTAGNDSGASYKAGTETIPALFYANKAQTPLLSLYTFTSDTMGITSDQVLNGYVNMRVSSDEAFTNGYYVNELDVIVLDSTLTLGLKVEGHEGSSWCAFRNFTLTYYGFDISTNLQILQDEISVFESENFNDDPYLSNLQLGIFYGLDDMLQDSYNYLGQETEVVTGVYMALDSIFQEVKASIPYFTTFKAYLAEAADLLANTSYPGKAKLTIVNTQAKNFLADDYVTNAELIEWCTKLNKAINDYKFTQTATNDSPMDASFMILNRSFRIDQSDTTETALRTSSGWVNGSVYASGDFTTYYNQGYTCFNSWSVSFTSMDIYQNIVGLPAGVYSVKCIALTQSGCLNDQHAYAQSSIMTANSPYMTIEGWDTSGSFTSGQGTSGTGIWETLTTTKVLLAEGDTLRIGMASTYDANNVAANTANGWFCMTDFELMYYGSDASSLLSEYMTSLNTMLGEMELAGDRKAVEEYIATANAAATDTEKYKAIGAALSLGNASINAYNEFINGVEAEAIGVIEAATSEYVKTVGNQTGKKIEEMLASDTASYTQLIALTSLAETYITYFNALGTADEALAMADNDYTAKLRSIIEEQQAALTASLTTSEVLNEYMTKLTYAAADIQLSLILDGTGNEDLTFALVNPELSTNGNGWTVAEGSLAWGSNVAEFYNETYNFYQTISVPNGTYTVTVYGYNRPGANSAATMEAESAATFYANEVEQPLLTVYSNRYEEQLTTSDYEVAVYNEDSSEVVYYYYPNNLAAAGTALIDNGDYMNTIDVTVTNNTLTVGVKQTTAISSSWTALCNFAIFLNTLGDNSGWVIDTKINNLQQLPQISVADGVISVNSDSYRIYSIDGKDVTTKGKSGKGVYMVRCGSSCAKVLVK